MIRITGPVPPAFCARLSILAAAASPQSAKAIEKGATKKFTKELEKHLLGLRVRHRRNTTTLCEWKRDSNKLSPEALRAQLRKLDELAKQSDNIDEIRKKRYELKTGACKADHFWMAFMTLVGYERFLACIRGA